MEGSGEGKMNDPDFRMMFAMCQWYVYEQEFDRMGPQSRKAALDNWWKDCEKICEAKMPELFSAPADSDFIL